MDVGALTRLRSASVGILCTLAFTLFASSALAQNGPGAYGGGYPGAAYSGQAQMLADLLFNGAPSVTGTITGGSTPVAVLQASPTIWAPNFLGVGGAAGGLFTLDGTLAFNHSTNYHQVIDPSGTNAALQAGNVSDPTNYLNNTTNVFRDRSLVEYGRISASGMTITSVGSNALAVGRQGSTSPAFNVNAATGSSATGWQVTAAAAAGGANLSVISSGTNETGTIDAKGSGTIDLNTTGTGNVRALRNFDIAHNSTPTLTCGTSGNVACTFTSLGSGGHIFKGASGGTLLTIDTAGQTSGIVNSMILRAQITGGGPSFIANGSDTDVAINFASKAAGNINFFSDQLSAQQFAVIKTASSTRWLTVTGSNGGNPTLSTSAGQIAFGTTINGSDATMTGTIRANTAFSANGTAGQSVTTTVRASGGAADCTLIFTFGLKTGGTC